MGRNTTNSGHGSTHTATPPISNTYSTHLIPEVFSAAPNESVELFFTNFERLAAIGG